jgi:hypothetical protein
MYKRKAKMNLRSKYVEINAKRKTEKKEMSCEIQPTKL